MEDPAVHHPNAKYFSFLVMFTFRGMATNESDGFVRPKDQMKSLGMFPVPEDGNHMLISHLA